MTAQEAKTLANKHLLQDTEGEYQIIIKKITESATKGSFHISITSNLHDLVKARLIEDGYEVKYIQGDFRDQRESSYYTINWK